jgi:hypothetical protein
MVVWQQTRSHLVTLYTVVKHAVFRDYNDEMAATDVAGSTLVWL